MSAQVLQIFFGKEHLVKSGLISKVIYFKRNIFSGGHKTSLPLRVEIR
jgi:hypothetical protein